MMNSFSMALRLALRAVEASTLACTPTMLCFSGRARLAGQVSSVSFGPVSECRHVRDSLPDLERQPPPTLAREMPRLPDCVGSAWSPLESVDHDAGGRFGAFEPRRAAKR